MAIERQGASVDKTTIYVGNPSIIGVGIDKKYNESDKKQWFIKCSSCGEWIHPDFFTHVVKIEGDICIVLDKNWDKISNNINCICDKCGKPFNRFVLGEWIKQKESDISGRHISKMFSTTNTLYEILQRYSEGLTNDSIMQRFYNADLGLAFTATGAKITVDMLDACIHDYTMPTESKAITVLGIDVGALLHIRINELLPSGSRRAVYIGTVTHDYEVIELWRRYNCKIGLIDSMPETRLSKKLVTVLPGLFMSRYIHGIKDSIDIHNKILSSDRTQTLDAIKERIIKQEIQLPMNAASIPDYYKHIQELTRVLNEKTNEYCWEGDGADHYFHAEGYCLLAEKLFKMI